MASVFGRIKMNQSECKRGPAHWMADVCLDLLTSGLERCVSTASIGSFICSTLQPYATGVNLIIVCRGTSRYGRSSGNGRITIKIWIKEQMLLCYIEEKKNDDRTSS